jgi:hypothetical protein
MLHLLAPERGGKNKAPGEAKRNPGFHVIYMIESPRMGATEESWMIKSTGPLGVLYFTFIFHSDLGFEILDLGFEI